MKKFIYILLLVAAVSCTSEIETYHGESGVYFAMREKVSTVNVDTLYRESTALPFVVTESKDSLFRLRVKILGEVSDHDRQVKVRVVEDMTSVLESDYEPLKDSYVLEAGEVYGIIPVHFYRTSTLKGKERSLTLELVENEDFTLPIRRWRNSSTEFVNVIRHTIVISDKYVQLPGYHQGHFGDFSETKMKLILELSGMNLNQFSETLPTTLTRTIGQKLDRYLKEMKAKGTPVLEADGTEMTAGEYIYL